MHHARHIISIILVTLAVVLTATTGRAQTFTGSIAGTVKDPGDLVLPGVTVTTTNVNTGQVRTVVSGSGGEFIFPGLQPGEYQVDAELAGFTKKSMTSITVQVNQRVEVPIRLEVGQVTETVSVVGGVTLVDTTATVGQVIEERRVVDLPLNGRDFVQLATLSAGIENRQTTRGLLSTNGTRGNGLGFLFDGVDGNDANAIFLSLTPSIEAIQEFKIQTSTYSAEFGRNAGAQINLVTKAGTNDLHGSAFYFMRDESLDAKNYFDPPNDPIPPFSRNQFGFVVNGPVRRNRTFFLGNYEGTRQNKALTALATVPTLAERNGDFSRTVNPATGALIAITDPQTGLPFPGNLIPSNRIDSTGRKVAALYPEPNRAGTQNFVSTPPQTFDADLLTVRVDHTFSSKDMFFARYFLSDSMEFNPFGRVANAGGTNVPGFVVSIPSRGQNLALNWTRVMSPRLLLEARFGFHRYNTGRYQDNSCRWRGRARHRRTAQRTHRPRLSALYDHGLHDGWRSQRPATGSAAEHLPLLREPDLPHGRSRHPHWIRGPASGRGSVCEYQHSRRLHLQPDLHRLCAGRCAARVADAGHVDDAGPDRQLARHVVWHLRSGRLEAHVPLDGQPRPSLRLLHAGHRCVRPSGHLRLFGQHHQTGRHQRHSASGLPSRPQQLCSKVRLRLLAAWRHAPGHTRWIRHLLRQGELEHSCGLEQPAVVPYVAAVPAARVHQPGLQRGGDGSGAECQRVADGLPGRVPTTSGTCLSKASRS